MGIEMVMFILVIATMLLGQIVHILLDRAPDRRTISRRVTLGLLWVVAGSGFWVFVAGAAYLMASIMGNWHATLAPFALVHWELAWADVALGVLLMGCIPLRNRGSWLDAAVLAMVLLYVTDVIGNIILIVGGHEHTTVHIWSIPQQLTQCVLVIVYLLLYRRFASQKVDTGKRETYVHK